MLIATILLVQFVAFFGALLFGRLAATVRRQAGRSWWAWSSGCSSSPSGCFLPEDRSCRSCSSALAIGIVLGGTQALARSYFSLLIPRGREAEFFSFYHAMDRGTSWFGTLTSASSTS